MSFECGCRAKHARRRVVLTGGPGAGKTAVLELIRQSLCEHVQVLPEAAGVVFGGGFPRLESVGARQAAQRAIYQVQLELEAVADANGAAIVLCDRGALDGAAYWPGPESFCDAIGTTREAIYQRYDTVIHLRVPAAEQGYHRENPLRRETVDEARRIDDRIAEAWSAHPHRFVIDATDDFLQKANRAITLLRRELPACCRPAVADHRSTVAPAAALLSTR